MATINIKPNDTLLFRDSKPFQAGEDTWATGTFPPYPSVLYGAIRTGYFAKNINRFNALVKVNKGSKEDNKLNTESDETTKLKINSYSLNINGENYFPVPLDFNYFEKNVENPHLKQVKYKPKGENFYSNYPLSHTPDLSVFIGGNKEFDNVVDGLIKQSDLASYLGGNANNVRFKQIGDLGNVEPKVGIARKFETRTTEEGKLYRVGMFRMREGVALNVSFSEIDLDDSGFLKLGGEGKSVVYESVSDSQLVKKPSLKPNNTKFKLYLSTPAVFKDNGWIPDWIDPDSGYTGTIPSTNTKVKLICAFTGKAKYLSGFDMNKGRPKPMLRVIPAGSVYYFEVQGEGNTDWDKVSGALHGKSISSGDYAKQGFGISYIGKIKG